MSDFSHEVAVGTYMSHPGPSLQNFLDLASLVIWVDHHSSVDSSGPSVLQMVQFEAIVT